MSLLDTGGQSFALALAHWILAISEHFDLLSKECVPVFLESLCCA